VPELPEVETVRDGLERHVRGRVVRQVEILRESAVRRHVGGSADFGSRLVGRRFEAVVRRGKYLWLVLDGQLSSGVPGATPHEPDEAVLAHLGMSGQLLVRQASAPPDHPHLRARLWLDGDGDGVVLDFVDQRTFGHLSLVDLEPTHDGAPGGRGSQLARVPVPAAHIARDLLDPAVDRSALVAAVRRRRTELKRALLDQSLVSGIGNIYADESLWMAQLHGARRTDLLRPIEVVRVLDAAEEVMRSAIRAGGTSFDALYVDVNGSSGYFDRSLAVYGQAGRPCPRCGTPVERSAFMNRSSFTCPRCQPRPHTARRVRR